MNIATIKDIEEFLYLHGIIWEGEVYSTKSEKYHHASIVDFNSNEVKILWCDDGDVGVKIDDFNFTKYIVDVSYLSNTYKVEFDKDLSEEWQDYLLAKYKNKYAEQLLTYLQEQKIKIKHNIENEIAQLKKAITAKRNEKLSLLNKLTIRQFETKKLLNTEKNDQGTTEPAEQLSTVTTESI